MRSPHQLPVSSRAERRMLNLRGMENGSVPKSQGSVQQDSHAYLVAYFKKVTFVLPREWNGFNLLFSGLCLLNVVTLINVIIMDRQ